MRPEMRLGLTAGVAMYAGELLFRTQTRDAFRLEWSVLLPLVAYAGVPALVARTGGIRALAGLLAALAAASTGLFCFGEASILPPSIRLVAGAVGLLGVAAAAWGLRRRLSPETAVAVWAAVWWLSVAAERLPRDAVLDVYNFRWRELTVRCAVALGLVALAGLGVAALRLAASRPRWGIAMATGVAGLVTGGFSGLGTRPDPGPGTPRGDIFYVILDSFRFDASSLPPNLGDTTPALAGLAARGTSFIDAHSPSTATEHSLPRLTLLAAERESNLRTRDEALDPAWDASLPGRLRAAGWRVHLVSDYPGTTLDGLDAYRWDSVALAPHRWFRLVTLGPSLWAVATGDEHALSTIDGDKDPFGSGGPAGALDEALAGTSGPAFYLIHLAVPHAPYNLPPYRVEGASIDEARTMFRVFQRLEGRPADDPTRDKLRALYRLAVRAADVQLAALLDVVARRRGTSDRLVVVTSDHGEPLGDHGIFGHGRSLFSEAHHVPLVMAGAGLPAGRVVDTPVSAADVPAAILAWAGLSADDPLRRAAEGADPGPLVVWHPRGTMVQRGRLRLAWTRERHLLSRPTSWNHRLEHELYDLEVDPGETQSRFTPEAAAALLDDLEGHAAIPEETRAEAARRRPGRGRADALPSDGAPAALP